MQKELTQHKMDKSHTPKIMIFGTSDQATREHTPRCYLATNAMCSDRRRWYGWSTRTWRDGEGEHSGKVGKRNKHSGPQTSKQQLMSG